MRAKEPASPRFVAPAPDVALAVKLLVPSPPNVSSLILAWRVIPLAVMLLLLPMLAWLVISTMFNATATPMPMALCPTALPSATALASVSFDVASFNCPCALITMLSPRVAMALELARFRARAAAIDTSPSVVLVFPVMAFLCSSLLGVSTLSSWVLI